MSRENVGKAARREGTPRMTLGKCIAQPLERQRLKSYCARVVGDADAAEDLAQETLVEAWRQAERLQDPERVHAWLKGIAWNMCLRWRRGQAQERSRCVPSDAQTLIEEREDPQAADMFAQMERNERDFLIERALTALRPEVRLLLILHYFEEQPSSEIAKRLGLSDNAASVRLHRARRSLHSVLTTRFWKDAAALGLFAWGESEQQTSIWCPFCGKGRLYSAPHNGEGVAANDFKLFCRECHFILGPRVTDYPSDCIFAHHAFRSAPLLQGVHGYKPALNRLLGFWNSYFEQGKEQGQVVCVGCGGRLALSSSRPAHLPPRPFAGLHTDCPRCGKIHVLLPSAFALCHPVVQRFWRQEGRIRFLPSVAIPGSDAFLLAAESVAGGARLDVLFRSDYRILETQSS